MLIYFLPAIMAIGLITSYEDIKDGKIRNKWILFGLAYAILVNIGVILYVLLSGTMEVNTHYLIEMFTDFIFIVLTGFFLWSFGIWTAGDGKLFIALAALIPISTYSVGYMEWIPSATLLINIFISSFIIMIIFMAFKFRKLKFKGLLRTVLKEVFNPVMLFNSLIAIFAIIWLLRNIMNLIGLGSNIVLLVILSMGVIIFINKKFGTRANKVMLLICLIRLLIDRSIYSIEFVKEFFLIVMIWIIIKGLLSGSITRLSQDAFSTEISIADLRLGMPLSETIEKKASLTDKKFAELNSSPLYKVMKHNDHYYIQKPKTAIAADDYLDEQPEGVTQEQIDKLKEIGVKRIRIGHTIPFAPFIFLGSIFTIIFQGNILIILIRIFT